MCVSRPRVSFQSHDSPQVTGSEKDLDQVLQVRNVFVNVSKGEVAKHNDFQKAFNTANIDEIILEVSP